MNLKEYRVGIIGVGNIGSAHAKCIAAGEIPDMRLTALCDTDSSRRTTLQKEYPDIPVFDSHQKLLESGLTDGIIIAAPHYFHPPIAIDGFAAGQHVLTEKPAGVTVKAVREMNACAAKSGKVFGIMFNQRTNPLFQKAREIVQGGLLGQPKRLVWIVTNWYRTQAYYNSGGWRATWDGEGGGVLMNQAPHNLDLLQWIFGMPKRIRAFCSPGKYHTIPVEDDATIYMEYENGATANFITSTGEYPGTNRLEISGDLGKLVLEEGKLRWWKLSQPEREFCFTAKEAFYQPETTYEEIISQESSLGHKEILQNFKDAILYGTPLLAPGTDGIQELSISNAAYLSSWTEDWVTLPVEEEVFDTYLQALCKKDTTMQKSGEQGITGEYSERWKVRW